MEKDSSKAAPVNAASLRRAALARGPRASSAADASTPRPSSSRPGAPSRSATTARAAKPKAAAEEAQEAGGKAACVRAKKTRQRQPDESRAQMLERLSNPLISLHEASVLLQVCAATVRRLANESELPHKRTEGGQRRFRLDDVMRLFEAREKRRAPASRASARSLAPQPSARPDSTPVLTTRHAPAGSEAHPAQRASATREEAARAAQGREKLAAMRARALEIQLAAQAQPGAQAPEAPCVRAGAATTAGEGERPKTPLRLGVARPLVPRVGASAREQDEEGAAQKALEPRASKGRNNSG